MQEPKKNGVYLEFVNYEEMLANLSVPPMFVNDIDVRTVKAKEYLNNLIRTEYDGDSVNVLPSCGCGELTGQHLATLKVRCSNCNTLVVSVLERPIESNLWIRVPKGVKALINPTFWIILDNTFKKSGFSVLRWLCDPYYRVPTSQLAYAAQLEGYGLERGLNNFHDHFDAYVAVLFENKCYTGGPEKRDSIQQLIREFRDLIFTKYLPIPNKIAFITERTSVGTYADFNMVDAIDAANTIVSLGESYQTPRLKKAESRATVCISQLAVYYNNLYRNILGGKKGWFRKHIFGTRANYSYRSVIGSITGWHLYDELHIPWTLAVSVLQLHITNKLLARGWDPNSIEEFISSKALEYDPLLDSIFEELIAESPHVVGTYNPIGVDPKDYREIRGIPSLFHRNPTLHRLSMQCFFITKVKKDPSINTVSISTHCVIGMNADFDGKALPSINLSNCGEVYYVVLLLLLAGNRLEYSSGNEPIEHSENVNHTDRSAQQSVLLH